MSTQHSYNEIEIILPALRQLLGDRLSLDQDILDDHGHDVSRHSSQAPQALSLIHI